MCGIALLVARRAPGEAQASLKKMLAAIAHRGPDDEGTWADESLGVFLGHRRLSILDTSERGHQPMVSASGRYVVAYNGEIYNYREIRKELDTVADGGAPAWRSGSDTEVLLAAIEAWGLQAALDKMVGMFAFVLWDKKERNAYLVRDRIGKKPLYYGTVDGNLLAASELSAFRAVSAELEVDHQAMSLLTRFGFIPEPYAAYKGVKKLLPGSYLKLPLAHMSDAVAQEPTQYYRFDEVIKSGAASRRKEWDPKDAVSLVEAELDQAVRQRLRSDVPFGAFLSGGIDSSLVVALMQKHVDTPVRTFSLGFDDAAFDESKYAAKIAEHLGTNHTQLIVRQSDVLDLVPEMARVYDEPFADSSQLPTTLVARLARQHVTVVLTGDGGDEMFAGYNRHVWGLRVWRLLSRLPYAARQPLSQALLRVSGESWDRLAAALAPVTPSRFRVIQAGEKARKLARLSGSATPEQMHLNLATMWLADERVTFVDEVARTRAEQGAEYLSDLTPLQRALWFDTVQGLPGDMLVKVDRATMSVGLEARQPLLDHRLLEASWKIPDSLKIRDGVGKWPLREVLAKYVPRPLWERPKSGFSVPIDAWLRGPLRDYCEELLSPRALARQGVFRQEPVRAAWQAHLSGKQNHGARLWAVLSAQAWLERAS